MNQFDFNRYYELKCFLQKKIPEKIAEILAKTILYIPNIYWWVSNYIENGFIEKFHILDTGFKRGSFYDLDRRILYAVFNGLKSFVEDELTDGVAHLQWEISLPENMIENGYQECERESLTRQSESAKEVLFLYEWWINHKDLNDLPYTTYEEEMRLYDEETEMLIRLMKIRGSLWS